MPKLRSRLTAATAATLALAGATAGVVTAQRTPNDVEVITASLKNAAGAEVGTVELRKSPRSAVTVILAARGLAPGYHGFHVHAVGRCDGPDFMTAGGHLKNAGEDHGSHKGDFPPLFVKKDGSGTARFTTDRFAFGDLKDADGSAVMLHALPDNLGNIPAARYSPAADQVTRDTGDSGPRVACGTVAAG